MRGAAQHRMTPGSIIDPWGTVVTQAPDAATIIRADIETDRVAAVRRQIPVLANRRPAVYR